MLRILGLVGFVVCAQSARSEPVKSLDFTIHQEYTSTRALGMGNAFTAVADDHSAMFYNPSTLAFRKDGHMRMFLRGGTDSNVLKLRGELSEVKAMPQNQQVQGYTDLITRHYGDHFYFRAPTIGAVWVRPGWGIAFIPADVSTDISVHRQIGPMMNVNLYMDSTLAFAYAQKENWFGKDNFGWGVTFKAVHRVYAGQAVSAGELADGTNVFSTQNANEGLTGDVDLGTNWRPDVPHKGFFKFLQSMKPSFALVGRNLVDYGFKKNFHFIDKQSKEPPKLVRRLDFGSKFEFPKLWVFDPHAAIDVRDVGHYNWSPKKGFHAGVELYWKMFNWWKGHWAVGMNQGYWTAGFGARLTWLQLDVCTFGEEVGSDSLPKQDRRYMVEMALDF